MDNAVSLFTLLVSILTAQNNKNKFKKNKAEDQGLGTKDMEFIWTYSIATSNGDSSSTLLLYLRKVCDVWDLATSDWHK